eukprot:TRINITY_DN31659_c0_g1_i1.p1 TRINITY_DN31659_c0_g1~~TRINITY_DN31659_c0_g1_i1.p1  ORF type:complete len:183 (-),score=51.92 TRINITY_DN31659_c0_g1_i1:46-594(-)
MAGCEMPREKTLNADEIDAGLRLVGDNVFMYMQFFNKKLKPPTAFQVHVYDQLLLGVELGLLAASSSSFPNEVQLKRLEGIIALFQELMAGCEMPREKLPESTVLKRIQYIKQVYGRPTDAIVGMITEGMFLKTEEQRQREAPYLLEDNLKALLAYRKKKMSDDAAGKFLVRHYGLIAGRFV